MAEDPVRHSGRYNKGFTYRSYNNEFVQDNGWLPIMGRAAEGRAPVTRARATGTADFWPGRPACSANGLPINP